MHVSQALLKPFVLFDRVDLDFLLSAAVLADTPFLDVPEPFHSVAIRVRA